MAILRFDQARGRTLTDHMPPADLLSALTVLVVDDDSPTRMMYAMWLREAGYIVLEARDGSDACGFLDGTVPDVVVTDLSMPGMRGEELCRFVRTVPAAARLPVFAVTGQMFNLVMHDVKDAGFCGLLSKPVEPDSLTGLVMSFGKARAECTACWNHTADFRKVTTEDRASLWLRPSCPMAKEEVNGTFGEAAGRGGQTMADRRERRHD